MKELPFQIQIANGLAGDPVCRLGFPQSSAGLFFDLGDLGAYTNREILKCRWAFVSHTHIDHFIGFSRLLRVNIPHHRVMNIVGPQGIIANVQGQLRGYTWNLLEPDQIVFRVFEYLGDGAWNVARLSNSHGFEAQPEAAPPGETIEVEGEGRVHVRQLDHGCPSLGYVFEEVQRYQMNVEAIASLGLEPGPWISELQLAVSQGKPSTVITANEREFEAGELQSKVMQVKPPIRIGYLTDVGFTRKNLDVIESLYTNADVLVCEMSFLDEHRDRARDKKHLTTKQAAFIAILCRVKQVRTFHVSNIYSDDLEVVPKEFKKFHGEFAEVTAEKLREMVKDEY